MTDIVSIYPHVPSVSPQVTRDFFVDLLGFEIQSESASFVELRRGKCKIGIQRSTGEPNQQSFYIEVRGIDELWQAKKESLANYKLRELFVQDYGMKGFDVLAPETRTLVFVGEPVQSREA